MIINSAANRDIDADANRKTRRAWSKADDDLLLAAVAKFGSEDEESIKWGVIARDVPGRPARSCRERYWNHLRPGVAGRGIWTAEDDRFLLQKVSEFGSKLTLISKFFPDRRPADVKNRFYYHLAGRSSAPATEGHDSDTSVVSGSFESSVDNRPSASTACPLPQEMPATAGCGIGFDWLSLGDVVDSGLSCFEDDLDLVARARLDNWW
jgi:hypothetical protein